MAAYMGSSFTGAARSRDCARPCITLKTGGASSAISHTLNRMPSMARREAESLACRYCADAYRAASFNESEADVDYFLFECLALQTADNHLGGNLTHPVTRNARTCQSRHDMIGEVEIAETDDCNIFWNPPT